MRPTAETPENTVLELVSFRLNDGVDPTAFLAAAADTAPILKGFGGCLGRHLSCDADGLWTDSVLWKDMDTALRAAETVVQDPGFAPFGAMIDGATVSMRHATVAWQMD